jgi:hypothetical protein
MEPPPPHRKRRPRWERAVRGEGHRLRSLRSQWALLSIATLGALAIGIAQILALPPGASSGRVVRAAISGVEISPFFVGLSATLFTSADLSSRQFGLTLLQLNDRLLVFGAKLVVLLVAALATGIGAVVVVAPLAFVTSGRLPVASSPSWMVLPVLHVLFALLGAATGMMMRSVVAAVIAYLAIVWALPLVVAVAGIWAPALSGPILHFAPVTLTAAMLEPATWSSAASRFGGLDIALLAVGTVRVLGWRIR